MQLTDIRSGIENFINSNSNTSEYYHKGFVEAGSHMGDLSSLELGLKKIWNEFLEYRNEEELSKEKTKEELKNRAEEISRKNEIVIKEISDIDSDIKENMEKIKEIKNEIISIKKSPEKYVTEKPDKLTYYITLSLLIGIALYLWVYYTSTVYSAFFRTFTLDENVVLNSIFYPKAITEAAKAGYMALFLILISPVVFLGIAFLYHKYKEVKKYFKMSTVLFVTFIFDSILSYEICMKIADIKSANSFAEVPEYRLMDAFVDVNYWLILFSGFVVYLVLGEIYTFFTEARYSLDVVKHTLNNQDNTIKEYQATIETLKEKKEKLQTDIASNNQEVEKIKANDYKIYFKMSEILPRITDYGRGWILYMKNAGKSEPELQQALELIKNFNKTQEEK